MIDQAQVTMGKTHVIVYRSNSRQDRISPKKSSWSRDN
jgi:hypothetical protein